MPLPFRAALAAAALAAALSGCGRRADDPRSVREYANALNQNGLTEQAVREYRRYLDASRPGRAERANITFVIANLEFERLEDYENALADYLRIRHVTPEPSLLPEVDKRIVACLERLNRSADARQALDEATALDRRKPGKPEPGAAVARINDRTLTNEDLRFALNRLPAELRNRIDTRERRVEFLRQMVASELFADAARRQGLDRDPDVARAGAEASRNAMVQKYLESQIGPKVRLTAADIELYYKANRERYSDAAADGKPARPQPFEAVRDRVASDLGLERQQQAVSELLNRMMGAENVRFFEDKVE